MASQYAPDESSSALWFEESVHAATHIGSMAYGVNIALYYLCVRSIVQDKSRKGWKWLPLVSSLFVLTTINICASINFNQLAWINDRDYPNGPFAFLVEQISRAPNIVSIVTYIATFVLCDGFLIYRCHVLWERKIVTAVFTVVLLVATVISILHSIQAAQPASNSLDITTLNFSIPYASLSMSLNVLLSISLAWRILSLRQKLPSDLSDEVKRLYTSPEAVIAESALIYGMVSLVFMILYGMGNIAANLFSSLIVQLESIAPQIIVLRMVQGHAWSLRAIRPVSPWNLMFRGDLGRSAQGGAQPGDDLSLATLAIRPSGPGNGVSKGLDQVV